MLVTHVWDFRPIFFTLLNPIWVGDLINRRAYTAKACAAHGTVYTAETSVASGCVYTTKACAAHRRIFTTKARDEPSHVNTTEECASSGRVYIMVFYTQRPVFLLEMSTIQGPELHLDLSTLPRPALLLEVFTLQRP